MPAFEKYSAFYNLLYADKDYAAETEYITRVIRGHSPSAQTILELGSGTGIHGRLLANKGFHVHGIERSPDMVGRAQSVKPSSADDIGSFHCEVGDICTTQIGRTFDAVIALFHVISYQATDQELRAAFQVAADHLAPGGLFLFDVWHGPAVLSQGPSKRVKEVANEQYRVKRTASPEVDPNRSTVKVVYEFDCEERASGEKWSFAEEHLMRYFSPSEVDLLARCCALTQLMTEEFLTAKPPSPSTWGVAYALRK